MFPVESLLKKFRLIARDDNSIFESIQRTDEKWVKKTKVSDRTDAKYTLFEVACGLGAIKIVSELLSKDENDGYISQKIVDELAADSNLALRVAAEGGHIQVVNRLLAKNVDGSYEFPAVIEKIAKKGNYALMMAVKGGHIEVVDRLLAKKPDGHYEFPAVIEKIVNDEHALSDALQKGHVQVVKRLLAKDAEGNFEFPAVTESVAHDMTIIRAAEGGHLDLINILFEIPAVRDGIAEHARHALDAAARCGHIHIVNRLLEIIAHNDQINFSTMHGLALAVEKGDIAFVNALLAIPAFVEQVASHQNQPLLKAIEGNFAEVFHRLLEFPAVVEHISDNGNSVLARAAGMRRVEMVNALLLKNDDGNYEYPAIISTILANPTYVLQEAARGGSIEVIERLLAKDDDGAYEFDSIIEHIADNGNQALKQAAEWGSAEVVSRLLDFPAVAELISDDDNAAFRRAASRGRAETVKKLLRYETVFSYAEQYIYEYGLHLTPFVANYISNIARIHNDSDSQPLSMNPQQASYAYYVLRFLIRTNAPVQQINVLLEIPEILALAARNDNELLQLALRLNNNVAAQRLMHIEEVATQARQHNFYVDRQDGATDADLRAVAANAESSMIALSASEQERYQNLESRYLAKIESQGVEAVLNNLRAYLKTEYEKAPAQFEGINLPFEWDALQNLRAEKGWNAPTYKKALQAYYQHPYHSAHRFLAKPNRWMADDASYVLVDESDSNLRYANFEGYEPMLALIWMAASDEDEPVVQMLGSDGMVKEKIDRQGRMEQFAQGIAYINRQHNRDAFTTILRDDGTSVRTHYDDMKGDKPSCFSGMKRGIFESLIQHSALVSKAYVPELVLEDNLRESMRSYYKAYFDSMSIQDLRNLKEIVDNYFIDFEVIPSIPNLTEATITQLKTDVNEKYPDRKVSGYENIEAYFLMKLDAKDTNDSHFLKYYSEFELGTLIDQSIAHKNQVRPGVG